MDAKNCSNVPLPNTSAPQQEDDEVACLEEKQQAFEDHVNKRLAEMRNEMFRANWEVEQFIASVQKLEEEKATLEQDVKAAKLQALEVATNCREVLERTKATMVQVESYERQRDLHQKEVVAKQQRVTKLQDEVKLANNLMEQLEARWKQGEKENEELLTRANSLRSVRERIEASAKSKENAIFKGAEKNLHRLTDYLEKVTEEISQLKLKEESSRIAALRRGFDGNLASRQTDFEAAPSSIHSTSTSTTFTEFEAHSRCRDVRREAECSMCLSEEVSVVFIPCGHQVVCTTCNELLEKKGVRECLACRASISQRVIARSASSSVFCS